VIVCERDHANPVRLGRRLYKGIQWGEEYHGSPWCVRILGPAGLSWKVGL